MCMIEGADAPTIYRSSLRRAHKEYECDECGRTIRVGEPYLYAFMVCEGYPQTNRVCRHCKVACDWLVRECGGFLHEVVWEDMREHAEEYPGIAHAINALMRGAERQWCRSNGTMLPLPKMPPPIDINIHARR